MINHTQESLEEFAAVIRELSGTAEEIARIEEEKASAATDKRHYLMDSFIQEEQASILKLRGLEQRRLRLADALGWKSLTFRQILEKADPAEASFLNPVFLDLERQLKRLGNAREASERILGTRIHELEVILARKQGGSYDNTGNVSLNAPPHSKLHDKYV
ncbi:flagellar protein FlgN [Clostridiaceae bacterium]|nr:flagellar protein FlgN [Lachnospiraceae bacterium]NBH73119.1 flagellar protein FlgN [Clostridiaceae bacterium]RKI11636.1 flagellar protein FlgN [bacterium 1XD21-70]